MSEYLHAYTCERSKTYSGVRRLCGEKAGRMKSKVFARESQWSKRFVSMRFCMVTTIYPPHPFV